MEGGRGEDLSIGATVWGGCAAIDRYGARASAGQGHEDNGPAHLARGPASDQILETVRDSLQLSDGAGRRELEEFACPRCRCMGGLFRGRWRWSP
jgi:hypothetical protein